jgi:ribosome biogenesis protein BMS1
MEKGLELDTKKDSEYKNIDRAPKTFMPFAVPKKL